MSGGWFAMKRGMHDHPLFHGQHERVYVWSWMLATAAWKDARQDAGGQIVTVKRGQLLTSLRQIASATMVSVKVVRNLLDRLEEEGAIGRECIGNKHGTPKGTGGGTARTLITIRNYDKYQGKQDEEGTASGTPKGTAGAQLGHTKEQDNKITIPPSEEASASQPVQVSVLSSAVWNAGKPFLASKGVGNPGGVIGRWLKDHSPMEVLSAIEAAQKAGTEDPVPYITQTLKGGTGSSSSRYREIIARSQT